MAYWIGQGEQTWTPRDGSSDATFDPPRGRLAAGRPNARELHVMILQTAIDIFVERVALPPQKAVLRPIVRQLIVNACRGCVRTDALVNEIVRRTGAEVELVRGVEELATRELSGDATIWLLIDDEADVAYCKLLRDDLKRERGVTLSLVAVAGITGEGFAGRLTRAQVGAGPLLSRRREIASGAETLLAQTSAGLAGA